MTLCNPAGGDGPAFVGLEQDSVGHHVELLQYLALRVVAASAAEHAGQTALADGDGNRLAGAGDGLDRQSQIRGNGSLVALFFNEEAGEGGMTSGRLDLRDEADD